MYKRAKKSRIGILITLFLFCFTILIADVTEKLERIVYPQELDFKDVNLSDALSLISKTSGITIIAESSIKNDPIDLFFVRGQSLKEILQAIMLANSLEIREVNNIMILEKSTQSKTEVVGQIIGRVVRAESETGIENSTVSLIKDNKIIKSVNAEAGGTYIIENIDPGTYIIKVSSEEYGENGDILEIEAGQTLNINLTLSSDKAQKLELTKENVAEETQESSIEEKKALGKVISEKGQIEETQKIFLKHVHPDEVRDVVTASIENIDVTSVEKQSLVILKGSKGNIDTAMKIIDELDIPVSQVRITAQVLELSDSISQNLGIDWSYQDGADETDSTTSVSVITGNPVATFTKYLSSSNEVFSATLNLLRNTNDVTVGAMPALVTVNGEEATITITEEEYVGETTETDDDGNKTTEPQYKEAGTTLSVKPIIRQGREEGDTIILNISLEVSSFKTSTSTVSDEDLEQKISAAEQKNSTQTIVRVQDGGVVFIGGLKRKSVTENNYSVPLFSKLPLIGRLFKYDTYVENSKDLFIQIKAEIVHAENSNAEISDSGFKNSSANIREKIFKN